MQTGGRRGNGAGMPRIHRLIALIVRRIRRARDVRRQRNLGVAIQIILERRVDRKAKAHETAGALEHSRGCAAGQLEVRTWPGWMAGFELHPRLIGRDDPLQKELDLPAVRRGLASIEARPDHAGVVEYQYIAGNEQIGQRSEREVGNPVAGNVQQAARRPLARGPLRNSFRR